eukprot:2894970-Pyramimonas_sp.AAC.1
MTVCQTVAFNVRMVSFSSHTSLLLLLAQCPPSLVSWGGPPPRPSPYVVVHSRPHAAYTAQPHDKHVKHDGKPRAMDMGSPRRPYSARAGTLC